MLISEGTVATKFKVESIVRYLFPLLIYDAVLYREMSSVTIMHAHSVVCT